MGLFQASFKRLQWKLTNKPEQRLKLLEVCMRMTNYRTHHVGQNQIATVFGNLGCVQKAALVNYYGAAPAGEYAPDQA